MSTGRGGMLAGWLITSAGWSGRVLCSPVRPNPRTVVVWADGSNPWWTAVQVLNHRLPVTTLEWSPDGSSWNSTERTDYNYFLASGGFGSNPVRVRVTALDGQTLVDPLPAVEPGLLVAGQAQFR